MRTFTAPSPMPGRQYLAVIVTSGVLLVAALGLLAIDRAMRISALKEAETTAQNEAAILAAGLESELDKFSLVPLVLARDPQVKSLISGSASQKSELNQRLEQLAQQTGAAAIYLMDSKGVTLAASNWNRPESFVGSNYRFRNYFRIALVSGVASEFALGTVSRRPGLYISRRVDATSGAIGVVAIKVEFDPLEAKWAKATSGVYVTDADGIILVTSDPSWRFSATRPIQPGQRDADQDLRQFGKAQLTHFKPGRDLTTRATAPLIESRRPLRSFNLELHLLSDPSTALAAAKANGRLLFLTLLVLAAAAAALFAIGVRRRRSRAAALLDERTAQLRDQLQQANRLATLGQITAGVGHEIRQPVAAIRILAETGERLGQRRDFAGAIENFSRIATLTERIGSITDELRRFSRRTNRTPRDVSLQQVVDGAALLLRDRISRLGIDLTLPPAADLGIVVRGEHVALEQVLVNLLQNALDATGQQGRVTIDVVATDQLIRLSVADNGPGLKPEQRDNLFQPFATTKTDGLGLGLVISQDIMRGLGGDLLADEVPSGARFTMVIPRT